MAGQFMWFDLGATDAGRARESYSALLGWAVALAGDAGSYQAWINDGEQPRVGIVHADTAAGAGWLPYVVVEGLDEASKRAVSLGATVIAGPAGTSVTIADSAGRGSRFSSRTPARADSRCDGSRGTTAA